MTAFPKSILTKMTMTTLTTFCVDIGDPDSECCLIQTTALFQGTAYTKKVS